MGGQRQVEARIKWRPKWGGRMKQGGTPEGSRGQKKVEAKIGWEAETGWETGGKERAKKSGGQKGVGG